MNTNPCRLQICDIEVLIIRKKIKNLHLAVLPPEGRVRVSAPLTLNDDIIRTMLVTRWGWIRKQRLKFENQSRQSLREYISGETHYFWGRRYRMEVIYEPTAPKISFKGKNKIVLSVKPGTCRIKREKIMMNWYRKQLRVVANKLIEYWKKKIGVQLNAWGIKKMKTRWGTCNPKLGRIWINLELAKKPEQCLEFIIAHELTHFLEKNHNERFKKYLDNFLPHWRQRKEELNQMTLSYEDWSNYAARP
jgi:hypothetical protein